MISEVIQTHPEYLPFFPGMEKEDIEPMKAVFKKCFIAVVTRCFGWGLPKTSLIPFADCINHHNVDSTYDFIHQELHIHSDDTDPLHGDKSYYTPIKMDSDYSDFFLNKVEGFKQIERAKWPNRTINQIRKVRSRKIVQQMAISEIESSQKEVWDVEYMSTSDEEDNDSDEDGTLEEAKQKAI